MTLDFPVRIKHKNSRAKPSNLSKEHSLHMDTDGSEAKPRRHPEKIFKCKVVRYPSSSTDTPSCMGRNAADHHKSQSDTHEPSKRGSKASDTAYPRRLVTSPVMEDSTIGEPYHPVDRSRTDPLTKSLHAYSGDLSQMERWEHEGFGEQPWNAIGYVPPKTTQAKYVYDEIKGRKGNKSENSSMIAEKGSSSSPD